MKFSCPKCGRTFSVPDEKLPKGDFKIRCPDCGTSFVVHRKKDEQAPSLAPPRNEKKEDNTVMVTCPRCGAKMKLALSKLPDRGMFKLKCPKCGETIVASRSMLTDTPSQGDSSTLTPPPVRDVTSSTIRGTVTPPPPSVPHPDSPVEQKYLAKIKGDIIGPVKKKDVLDWIKTGVLLPEDMLCYVGGEYKQASSFPEFIEPFGLAGVAASDDTIMQRGMKVASRKEWGLIDVVYGLTSGMLGGVGCSIMAAMLSMFGLSFFFGAGAALIILLMRIIAWGILGGFIGTIIAVLEGFMLKQGNDVYPWNYRQGPAIGAVVGLGLGLIILILGGNILSVIDWVINASLLAAATIFFYKTIFGH